MTSRKRPLSPPASPSTTHDHVSTLSQRGAKQAESDTQIFRSNAIKDRASSFIAIFSPRVQSTRSQSSPFSADLQSHPLVKTATHRIAAWRKASTQQSLFATTSSSLQQQQQQRRLYEAHHDDDGEKYAGKRLEKILVQMDVEGVVVVGRWYGGVLLGPVRFDHIENCAREAIGKWKEEQGCWDGDRLREAKRKRQAVEAEDEGGRDEAGETMTLAAALRERDQNIMALRGLLAEKAGEARLGAGQTVDRSEGSSHASKPDNDMFKLERPTTAPMKAGSAVDYSTMPLPVLKRMEKARDATMSWILKEIEKVECQRLQPQQQSLTSQDVG